MIKGWYLATTYITPKKMELQFAKQNIVIYCDKSVRLRKHLNRLSVLKSTVVQFRLLHPMADDVTEIQFSTSDLNYVRF